MPIQECTLPEGGTGWKWGESGHCYADRADAEKQAQAAYANGYAGDEALAFDRASARTYDADNRLHVTRSNISKAVINPYLGREIPDYEDLGLDPDRIYQMYRDPEELEKAAPTFNNLPILSKHVPVSAERPEQALVIGSTGTDAAFDGTYLTNSLVFWVRDAIRLIEDEVQKELSCSYRYRPDMTPGTVNGEAYDGVMRDIRGNHVALVSEGRAGPDVVVGDSAEEINMAIKLSRKAAFLSGVATAHVLPKLATDAKVDLVPAFAGVTGKNFAEKKGAIVASIAERCKGKLAADQDLGDIAEVLEAIAPLAVPEVEDEDPSLEQSDAPGPEKRATDNDPMARVLEFLRGKLSPEDMAQIDAICGGAMDAEPDEKGKEDDKKEKGEMVDKAAMDSAIRDAEGRVVARFSALREAERAVRPYVGELVACDSAEAVYSTALKMLGVDVKDIHPSAYPAILKMQPVPGAKPKASTPVAMDAARSKSYAERFPDAARLGRA